MGLSPVDWSVVIAGRWNRAILTPAGIASRLFRTGDQEQLAVLVPLDGVSPFIVRDIGGDVSVMTDESRLLIRVENMTYDCLEKAMTYGVNALESLEHTPVSAAGFNVNYQSDDLPTEAAMLIAADIDRRLSNVPQKVVSRAVGRSFEFGLGQLKLALTAEEQSFKVLGNFHRASTEVGDLKTWLSTPVADIRSAIEKLLNAFDLHIEESHDASDGQ
jgi:hypothetical protein